MEAGGLSPVSRLRGIFVTGTGTGVGKSVLAASICAALAARGEKVAAFKPVITGLDERDGEWPLDDELLAQHASAGQSREEVSPHRFGPPVSPHLAAEMAGEQIEPLALAREAGELDLPLVIAAQTGLGTINHTLLTIEAARAAGLNVTGVVLTPWPSDPDEVQRNNRETIGRLGEVPVCVLPETKPGDVAQAGAELPVDDWLEVAQNTPHDIAETDEEH